MKMDWKHAVRLAITCVAMLVSIVARAEDWKYVKSIQIPRPYVPIFAAVTPSGDCVVATFNNIRADQPVALPVIYIHKPLSETPGFYVVCTNSFAALRGYSGVAVDSAGNYYVAADTGAEDSWIRKFRPDGKPDTSFGTNGEIRPMRRVLGLDLTGTYLFTTFNFGELACYDARTGKLVGRLPAPPKGAPPIRDVALDPTRETIYGVANGAAWAWRGGKFNNLSGYKLERVTADTLQNPKAGEGVYFDAFGDRLLMPVSDLAALFAIDAKGNVSRSEIAGAQGVVQSPADAVLLADGETLFITDMKAGPSGECLIHVMKRMSPVTKSAGADEVTLPSLADSGLLKAAAPAGQAAAAPSATAGAPAGVEWRTSFNAAFEEARRTRKPVLLYGRTAAARRCQELESGFLKSPEFIKAAAQVVPFFFDVTSDAKLAQQLGIFRVPYIAIYRPDGERIEMWLGRFETSDVLAKLQQVGQ
jgi:DNA-binding beta-propeller fold protein YncE